jgi:hypothetical protein
MFSFWRTSMTTKHKNRIGRPKHVKSVPPLVGAGLVVRRVRVQPREVVFLKGVLEASEGLAVLFAEAGGDLTVAACTSQAGELDRVLADLEVEIGALVEPEHRER